MLPHELKPEHFNGYPPEARKLAVRYLVALQGLPLSFVPNLLREAIYYRSRRKAPAFKHGDYKPTFAYDLIPLPLDSVQKRVELVVAAVG
jgi:predicted ATPase